MIALVLALAAAPIQAAPDPLIAKLERRATRGDAAALYHLGMAYQTGSGGAVDHRKALDLFRQAAAKGDPQGAYKLGCFHAGQDGVLPFDEGEALRWKLVAATAGYALAQQDVAAIHAHRGNGPEAEAWLAKAAAQGWPDALMGYASMHNGQNGMPRDPAILHAYFRLFLATREPDAEQVRWLAELETTMSLAEHRGADRIVAAYRPRPTPLTIAALSGRRTAEALVSIAP